MPALPPSVRQWHLARNPRPNRFRPYRTDEGRLRHGFRTQAPRPSTRKGEQKWIIKQSKPI